ncbi:Beta-lactamase enzyme family [Bifidobacterium italicum]|uniref:Beta-lactamase enzyme family n=1 Tax=Bifidobacterium italicum TaxID=1960968 RepID=A0A2A2EKZ5_9BIFI|nr:serine hydrolase [Bifidobacterium italicum]PAU69894.1 Beta-lactamase enzyme family [Bifidobacterium italicum]
MQKKTRRGTSPKWRDVPLTDAQFDIAIAGHRRSIAKWKGIAIAASVVAMGGLLSAGAVGVFGDGPASAAHPAASAMQTAPSPTSPASDAAETPSDGIEKTIVTPNLNDVVAAAFTNLRAADTAAAVSAAGVTLSDAESAQLQRAISAYHEEGFEVSFAVVDMRTGAVVTSFANVPRYSASSIKAPYILSLAQTGAFDLDAVSTSVDADAAYPNRLITATLTVSDNDSYESLYRRYGTPPFTAWTAGYTFDAPLIGYYEFLTASDLARLWVLGYQYLFSDTAPAKADGAAPASPEARAWLAQQMRGSLNSSIQMAHTENEEVYTKAGWIYGEGGLYALNDAGIVLPAGAHDLQTHPQGYVLAILSDACGRNDLLSALATTVDDVIADLHGES